MSRSLYDEDGVDGPWLKAMEAPIPGVAGGAWSRGTGEPKQAQRLRFVLDDGLTREGYLQGAGGFVRTLDAARRHVRIAQSGKTLRIATPSHLPTHGFIYSTTDGWETCVVSTVDLMRVKRVEAA